MGLFRATGGVSEVGVLGFGEAGEEGRCLGCSRVHSEAPRGLGVSGGGVAGTLGDPGDLTPPPL